MPCDPGTSLVIAAALALAAACFALAAAGLGWGARIAIGAVGFLLALAWRRNAWR
jgi:hypothetical protein